MDRLARLYRTRIVHINVNAIVAGILSLILSANLVYLTKYLTDEPFAIAFLSFLTDGFFDFVIFAGIHLAFYSHKLDRWKFAKIVAQDLTMLQAHRVALAILTFIIGAGIHLALMNIGFGRTRAFIIAYLLAMLGTRTAHTLYGLQTGLFKPLQWHRKS